MRAHSNQMSLYWTEKKRPREAEAAVQRAVSIVPYSADFWAQLARVYYIEGAPERAREPAERALSLAPNDPEIGNLHAIVQAECADGTKLDLAAQEARLLELLKEDPENHSLQHNLGAFYLNDKADYERAVQHLSTAVSLDPSYRPSRTALAQALRHLDGFLKWFYFPYRFLPLANGGLRWAAKTRWGYAPVALAGLALFLPVLLLIVFWAIVLWPLAKIYEWLTVAELRERMKVHGHPGPFGIHHWPRGVRLLVVLVAYSAFWALLIGFWNTLPVKLFLGLSLALVFMEFSGLSVKEQLRQIREDWRNR